MNKYTETLSLCAGNPVATLTKVENSAGDIYFRIRIRGSESTKCEYSTLVEFSNIENAYDYFHKHCVNKVVKS